MKAFDSRFNNSRYEVQTSLFLEQAAAANLPVMYVASGNQTEVARFRKDARLTHNMAIVTKSELLEEQDLEQLQRLTWDQQALVDFLVMLKASGFSGVGHSSFALNCLSEALG